MILTMKIDRVFFINLTFIFLIQKQWKIFSNYNTLKARRTTTLINRKDKVVMGTAVYQTCHSDTDTTTTTTAITLTPEDEK